MGVYERPLRAKADDMRQDGEPFCADCPDHEGCMSGYPCWKVREVHNEWALANGRPDEVVPNGELALAESIPYKGWKASIEQWALVWNFPTLARFMAWWDERKLGK